MPDFWKLFIWDTKMREWRTHLTPERRAHFKRVGVASVQNDVSHHNYNTQEKQFGALAWLNERRIIRGIVIYGGLAMAALSAVGLGQLIWGS